MEMAQRAAIGATQPLLPVSKLQSQFGGALSLISGAVLLLRGSSEITTRAESPESTSVYSFSHSHL